jgi:hypothetical protein
MRQQAVIQTMGGGLLGTLLQTLMVYGVVPMMTGQPMDMATMLEYPCVLSMLGHALSGSVIFPLAYMLLPSPYFPGSPVIKGMLWAVLLWCIAEGILAPMLGAGVFSAALGGFPAAVRALLGYLVYGATLGGIAGAAAPKDRCALGAL